MICGVKVFGRDEEGSLVQFCKSIQFLSLDQDMVDEVIATGETKRKNFTKSGLCYFGEGEENGNLSPVGFDKCIVIKKRDLKDSFLASDWNERGLSSCISLFLSSKGMLKESRIAEKPKAKSLLDFGRSQVIGRTDIWFNENEIQERPITLGNLKPNLTYEHLHKTVSPVIYWMFQVAFNRNELGSIPGSEESIKKILMGIAGKLVDYFDKETAQALIDDHKARFAYLLIKNSKSKGSSRFDLGQWERYREKAPFISLKLAAAIGLADEWAKTMRALDEKLSKRKFELKVRSDRLVEDARAFHLRICEFFPRGRADELFQLITGRVLPPSGKDVKGKRDVEDSGTSTSS